jgi:hypothetical protein
LTVGKVRQLLEKLLRLLENNSKPTGIPVDDAAEDVGLAHALEIHGNVDELFELLIVGLLELFKRRLEHQLLALKH